MDSNYYQIVNESLNGERAVDEQTFASLAVLTERLEQLKKIDNTFSGVTFSSAAKKLAKREIPMAV